MRCFCLSLFLGCLKLPGKVPESRGVLGSPSSKEGGGPVKEATEKGKEGNRYLLMGCCVLDSV